MTKSTRKRKEPQSLLDQQLDQYLDAVFDKNGRPSNPLDLNSTIREFAKRLIERSLQGELDHHLQSENPIARALDETPNCDDLEPLGIPKNKRNGTTPKTIRSDYGPVQIDVPRDRHGTFEPVLVPKHARTVGILDDKIIALYSRGVSTRDIQSYIREMYGHEVSAEFVSSVTDRVLEDIAAWQSRPLENIYPVVFFDALRVKIRSGAGIKSMAMHLALGIGPDGRRDVLGMWLGENEGASFWAGIFSELKTRGVNDILIAVTDGLKGMTEALGAVFPKAEHQTCIVHLIRASTAFVSYKDRKPMCAMLKDIYARLPWMKPNKRCRLLKIPNWGAAMRPRYGFGETLGPRSLRSSHFRGKSARSSTRRTPLRA